MNAAFLRGDVGAQCILSPPHDQVSRFPCGGVVLPKPISFVGMGLLLSELCFITLEDLSFFTTICKSRSTDFVSSSPFFYAFMIVRIKAERDGLSAIAISGGLARTFFLIFSFFLLWLCCLSSGFTSRSNVFHRS